jgi:2,4-dienoyl-CoA reductase-like NADH-dependent reductase (Old Yellow Enzyme family)
MNSDIIFEPLSFRNLTVKNRILRSNMSGRFDNYDGSGTQARINWEEKFARGGVGAILSAHVPVTIRGRIFPNYATIDRDESIPFWRGLGERMHEYDCKFILQLSHAGRQQDMPGIENLGRKAQSSTSRPDPLHGFECQAMTREEIKDAVRLFADGARRAREAGLDGVETHSAHGYLITQFLSSGINDREDEYGGSLENRARFLLEIIRAIRKEVGDDFHVQAKINGIDYNDAVSPWKDEGDGLKDSIQIAKWLEEAGVDAIHVSTGSFYPHPINPTGGFPLDVMSRSYVAMLASGRRTFTNYLMMRYKITRPILRFMWERTKGDVLEGSCVDEAREIKQHVNVPVLCTGGFQHASYIRRIINEGYCDGVTIARSLIANNDLVEIFAQGKDVPDRPCTYCNRCLFGLMDSPLACYDLSRYDGDYDRMMREAMSVFEPTGFE